MITTGLTLASLTALGFYLIYRKLPNRVKTWMCKHPLLTDIVACLLTYILFGGTIVALFAAAFMGIIVSLMLAVVNNPKMVKLLEKGIEKLVALKDTIISLLEKLAGEENPADLHIVKDAANA